MFKSIKLYSAIVLAMIFWSFSFIWTRVAIQSFPPMTLITTRLILASILLFLVAKLTGKFQIIRKQDLKLFLLLAFFEPFLYYVGETLGLTMVQSTLAAVLISTIPLFAPIAANILLKERIGLPNFLGIIVSLVGVIFVIYEPVEGFNANPLGIALIFLAVFSAVCYTIILRKIPEHYSTLNVIFYQSAIGIFFFIPTLLLTESKAISHLHVSKESFLALIMLSVFASVIAFVLFAWAVRKVGVARTNVFVNLIPVFTAIFSWLLLNEILSATKWMGIGIVILGLFVSQSGKLRFNKKIEDEIL